MRFINMVQCIDKWISFPFRSDDWFRYAESISKELPEKCLSDSSGYIFNEEVLPVICNALKDKQRMDALSKLFNKLGAELENRLSLLFNTMPDVSIILYLGLCNGAGWATKLEGKDVVLLGIEKIIELNWDTVDQMRALVYHEIGHIWHRHVCKALDKQDSCRIQSIHQLFCEGIAMVCEQILCNDKNYYHQGEAWLEWCNDHLGEIKAEYLRRIQSQESTRDFFGDWNMVMDHSDIGYYLGAQFIRYMLNKYTLTEIAVFQDERLINEYEEYVRS